MLIFTASRLLHAFDAIISALVFVLDVFDNDAKSAKK